MKLTEELLSDLTKEQLIYLIKQLNQSQFLISTVCVEESKCHIDSDKAVEKIRGYIYSIPGIHKSKELKAYIDMKMNKISLSSYKKIIGMD